MHNVGMQNPYDFLKKTKKNKKIKKQFYFKLHDKGFEKIKHL